MRADKPKVIAVVGPTASGKTSLGVQLALELSGEVVSGDSMQIYSGMDIATAKPTKEEMRGVPHHLIGYVSPHEKYSAARYVADASACISGIISRGHLPIVVGGTGLYIDSLLQGVEFGEMPDSSEVRKQLYARLEREGARALIEEIRAVDPETAAQLHENNAKRIVRALEIYTLTGRTVTEQKESSRPPEPPYDATYIFINYADRNILYDRIDRRVDEMLRLGLLDETRRFARDVLKTDATAAQAIGYKELMPYINGEKTLDECVLSLKTATRHYAKRQITWFSRNESAFRVYPDTEPEFFRDCIDMIRR